VIEANGKSLKVRKKKKITTKKRRKENWSLSLEGNDYSRRQRFKWSTQACRIEVMYRRRFGAKELGGRRGINNDEKMGKQVEMFAHG